VRLSALPPQVQHLPLDLSAFVAGVRRHRPALEVVPVIFPVWIQVESPTAAILHLEGRLRGAVRSGCVPGVLNGFGRIKGSVDGTSRVGAVGAVAHRLSPVVSAEYAE
jgi:hypothetical protein